MNYLAKGTEAEKLTAQRSKSHHNIPSELPGSNKNKGQTSI